MPSVELLIRGAQVCERVVQQVLERRGQAAAGGVKQLQRTQQLAQGGQGRGCGALQGLQGRGDEQARLGDQRAGGVEAGRGQVGRQRAQVSGLQAPPLARHAEHLRIDQRDAGQRRCCGGVTAQAGDLKKAMKGKEAERESLQNKVRELEAELADKRGELDEAQSSIQAKQKEMQTLREKKDKEVEAERQALATLREAERKLKEENVGLKARVRRLTEHG